MMLPLRDLRAEASTAVTASVIVGRSRKGGNEKPSVPKVLGGSQKIFWDTLKAL